MNLPLFLCSIRTFFHLTKHVVIFTKITYFTAKGKQFFFVSSICIYLNHHAFEMTSLLIMNESNQISSMTNRLNNIIRIFIICERWIQIWRRGIVFAIKLRGYIYNWFSNLLSTINSYFFWGGVYFFAFSRLISTARGKVLYLTNEAICHKYQKWIEECTHTHCRVKSSWGRRAWAG